jgi:hypothetical protein
VTDLVDSNARLTHIALNQRSRQSICRVEKRINLEKGIMFKIMFHTNRTNFEVGPKLIFVNVNRNNHLRHLDRLFAPSIQVATHVFDSLGRTSLGSL